MQSVIVTENYNTGNLKKTTLRRVQLLNKHRTWSVEIYSSKYSNYFPQKLRKIKEIQEYVAG